MMGVGAHRNHAHPADLMGAGEWCCERRAACAEARLRSKAGVETRRTGHKRRDAVRARVLGYGQGAVVLHEFFGATFKNDPVVIDAIATANNRLPCAKRIIGEADARTEVLLVG